MRYQKSKKTKKEHTFFIVFFLFVFLSLILVYKNITTSVFWKRKERVNIVFYGEKSLFYSLADEVDYFFSLPADIEVLIPGGYGRYRLGGLGKLTFLEKKPDIFKTTFSSVCSCAVDLYFYPTVEKIYYGGDSVVSLPVFPSLRQIFFNRSNGNIVDRIFLLFYFINKSPNRYKVITNLSLIKEEGRALFNQESFFKENQGLFYKKTYRNIKDNVQIVYTKSYKTAELLSRIIEGEGIRVVDITQISHFPQSAGELVTNDKKCLVIENKKKPSTVASFLQKFFDCRYKQGETEVSDIILVLGKLEKEWEIN